MARTHGSRRAQLGLWKLTRLKELMRQRYDLRQGSDGLCPNSDGIDERIEGLARGLLSMYPHLVVETKQTLHGEHLR